MNSQSSFVRFAVALLLLLALCGAVYAQPQTFIQPTWGGSVGHPFDDTHAALEGSYHTGIDFWGPNKQATYILASNVGVVDAIVPNDGVNDHHMGNSVIIRHAVVVSSHGNTYPFYTVYNHMDSVVNSLLVGQVVNRGQIIGVMGSTGKKQRYFWGPTPHLHFEVKTVSTLQNPYGGGPYWGYTPYPAENYGYINPAQVIGNWWAVPISR
jgi:murein DD-endopeptidase MepM/ murein hydrolase activator NlpD